MSEEIENVEQLEDEQLPTETKSEVALRKQDEALRASDTGISMSQAMALAAPLLASKWLDSVYKKPEQVAAMILRGAELGIKPMASLSHIHIIEGKPVLSSLAMAALVRRAGIYFELVKDFAPFKVVGKDKDGNQVEGVDYVTTIRWYVIFNGKERVQDISFTYSQARKLGLTGKDNWVKQKETMLYIRCFAKGARVVAPDALLGGSYEISELVDSDDYNGDITYEVDGRDTKIIHS